MDSRMDMTRNKIRGFVGVKSNDGHDAPILIVADILKKAGIEVVLGGYDLTADKFAQAVICEGVQFAGISSYNGGHIPFFKAVRDKLKVRNYPHIHLIGGGGATISSQDACFLEKEEGIDRIFKSGEANLCAPYVKEHYDFSMVPDDPQGWMEGVLDGNELAISGFLNLAEEKARLDTLVEESAEVPHRKDPAGTESSSPAETGRKYSAEREILLERSNRYGHYLSELEARAEKNRTTVYGITGRGGSGKSTLTDELILRYFRDPRMEKRKAAILAVDPSSHRSGGALLADRITYLYAADKNWVDTTRVYIRSLASRGYGNGIARALPDMIRVLKAAGYDIFVETYGIGQPDIGIAGLADKPVFVTTPDMGGATQIAKEEMLNVADVYVVLNKNELHGARHVSSLLRGKINSEKLFFTTAIEHGNPGVDRLYQSLTGHYG